MPYQFRGFGARGRVVFSPNQAVWQANQPTITEVVFSSGESNPTVEVSANTDSILQVTLASNLVGNIIIEGESFEIMDNSGTVVFASGKPEEYTFSGVNDFTIVSGAITENEYQVIYLGTGSIKYQVRPSRFKWSPPPPPSDLLFTKTSTGERHSMGIMADGTLWTWGNNSFGQLGIGDPSIYTESLVPVQIGSDTDWADVECGQLFTMARKTDGTVWTWGRNSRNQLGRSTTSIPEYIPGSINSTSYSMIAAGRESCAAIRSSDNSLWTWGGNLGGQLGLGFTSSSVSTPTQVASGNTSWTYISMGRDSTHGIGTNGHLYGCGWRQNGKVGDGSSASNARTTFVQIATGPWDSVHSGLDHSLAIKGDGTFWAWGTNNFGQLGLNTADFNKTVPTQNTDLVGTVSNVIIGHNQSHVVLDDGTLWGCGRNFYGELGNNSATAGTNNDTVAFVQIGADTDWVGSNGG